MENAILIVQILEVIIIPFMLIRINLKNSITQTQIGEAVKSAFSDVEICKEVIIRRITEGDEIRIALFKKLYSHYFDVIDFISEKRKDVNFDNNQQIESILSLNNLKLRKEVFINQIFLGGDLALILLKLQIGLSDAIANKDIMSNEYFPPDTLINDAEKWLQKHLNTFTDPSEFFTSTKDLNEIRRQTIECSLEGIKSNV